MLALLKKYWPHLIVLGCLLVVYLYWSDRTQQLVDLRNDNATLIAQLQTEQASHELNIRELEREIKSSNDEYERAEADYYELVETSNIARAELQARYEQRVDGLDKKIKLLESIPTPETCEGAIGLIVDIAEKNPWYVN